VFALDALYVDAATLPQVFGIRAGSARCFEPALVIALLGFVATATLANFLMRGEVIE
jgi:multicomponent K+:H+ antiporter subunit F